jgi:hypothetical protein
MNTVELLQFSVDNAFGILGQVTADLTQEQADWTPPNIANPIGATYWHVISGADEVVHHWCQGQEPLSKRDSWREQALSVAVPEPERGGDWLAYMQEIRVDLPLMHEYARLVCAAIQSWLALQTPDDLERKIETPIGVLSLAQMLATFVVWHIDAHCGEIAALKGCLGVRGYPF